MRREKRTSEQAMESQRAAAVTKHVRKPARSARARHAVPLQKTDGPHVRPRVIEHAAEEGNRFCCPCGAMHLLVAEDQLTIGWLRACENCGRVHFGLNDRGRELRRDLEAA